LSTEEAGKGLYFKQMNVQRFILHFPVHSSLSYPACHVFDGFCRKGSHEPCHAIGQLAEGPGGWRLGKTGKIDTLSGCGRGKKCLVYGGGER